VGDISSDLALALSADMLWTALYVAAPILGFSMLVGLLVSVLQVVTQIQEATLTCSCSVAGCSASSCSLRPPSSATCLPTSKPPMKATVEIAWIITVALVAIRLGAVLALTPVFGGANSPVRFRVLFVLGMSALIVSGLGVDPINVPFSLSAFATAAVTELALGAVLAFGIFATFAAFLLAGRIMDVQMGFGVAALIDPANRTPSPLVGTFLNLLAVAFFFAIDGHHLLIRGFVFSLERVPVGTFLTEVDPTAVVAQFGGMFTYAAALAAPVIFSILLIDVVLAVVARTMPQVNVFIVGLPLKIFVGLLMLAISLRYVGPLMARIFESLFDYWSEVLP
jgi:flagellar biosynthetic protein FliR